MTRFAIRGLLSRKLRTALTALAIVLGVAMISGTYVLTDSIDQAFDRIFTDIREGSTAVITGKSAFDLSEGSGVTEPTFDEALLGEVRALPGVAEAEGSVDGEATLIDDKGDAIVSGGAPNIGFSIASGWRFACAIYSRRIEEAYVAWIRRYVPATPERSSTRRRLVELRAQLDRKYPNAGLGMGVAMGVPGDSALPTAPPASAASTTCTKRCSSAL